jgi:hypothetical protein
MVTEASSALQNLLLAILSRRIDGAAASWLSDRARAIAADAAIDSLLVAYAAAGARAGRAPLNLDGSEQGRLAAAASGLRGERWTVDDAARAVLLGARRLGNRVGADFVADALACFEQGDSREQQSWLRVVAAWPEAAEFLPAAIDACRTNILPLFESVACENPYPARYFPDLNFNQMVLKALFNAVPVARIVGLDRRRNPELARMANDYAAERRAAGRSVPPDLGLATGDVPQVPR